MICQYKLFNVVAGACLLTGSAVFAMTALTRLAQPAAERPTVAVGETDTKIDEATGFALAAFPPTLTDKEWHHDAWMTDKCLDCHETGVGEAPQIRHYGLVALAMESRCRTCHVTEPGKLEPVTKEDHGPFVAYAFPPMLPNNTNHSDVWNTRDCRMCHEREIDGAPKVTHEGMVSLLLESACRTCHVQVRAHETIPPRD